MADDNNKKFKNQRNKEPMTIDTTLTGNHPRGNFLNSVMEDEGKLPPHEAVADVWFEQEDQAKQGMTRGFRVPDMKAAKAAPGRPHVGRDSGGEIQ